MFEFVKCCWSIFPFVDEKAVNVGGGGYEDSKKEKNTIKDFIFKERRSTSYLKIYSIKHKMHYRFKRFFL